MKKIKKAELIDRLLDSCFFAKKITETLPDLPEGMKPRHNYVLHSVYLLQDKAGGCRVSDVSKRLRTTMPSVTKLVAELAEKGLLLKYQDDRDGRVTLLKLTPSGYAYVKKYVLDFQAAWAERMGELSYAQVQEIVDILNRFSASMPPLTEEQEGPLNGR